MHKTNREAIGPEMSEALQSAFDFYNARLFNSELPGCAVIVHRHRGAYGYFWPKRWLHSSGGRDAHEIAIHPDFIPDRSPSEVLSTLVHEMCHLQRFVTGKPPRGGYHRRQWAAMMDAVGLTPSATAAPGGKRTGQKVSHFIVDGGSFDTATADLLASGFAFAWGTAAEVKVARAKKSGARVRYTCPDCDAKLWGKSGLGVACKPCGVDMEEAGGSDDEEGDE